MASGDILAILNRSMALSLDVGTSGFGITQQLANGVTCPAIDLTNTDLTFSPPPIPVGYSGGGWTITTRFIAPSATTNNVRISWAVERQAIGDAMATDAFATAVNSSSTTVPGTAGNLFQIAVNLSSSQIDGITTAGEWYRVRLKRITPDVGSNASGYLLFHGAVITEQ